MIDPIYFCRYVIYMALEILNNNIYDYKVVVYSFAIIMYQIISGSFSYPKYKMKKLSFDELNILIEKIKKGMRLKFSCFNNKNFKELIDPDKKPSFEEIYMKLAYKAEDPSVNYFR